MSERTHKPITIKLLGGVGVMFAFAIWGLPPWYVLFCELTGVGLQQQERYEAGEIDIDESRNIKVQFLASNSATMPWEFKPVEFEVTVNPGEPTEITYYAKNNTRRDMVGQAIPNISPASAVDFFHKTECFCFNNQPLLAGEAAELKMVFIIDPELPKSVRTITLNYTMFDISNRSVSNKLAIN